MVFVVLHKKESGETFGSKEGANRIAVPLDTILAIYDRQAGAVVMCGNGIGNIEVTETFDDIIELMGAKNG